MVISWWELRDARLLSGLTQAELALQMGVSVRSVQNYEKPEAEIPRKAEHAIRRVLASELEKVEQNRGVVEDVVLPAGEHNESRLNPRLAGITTSDMLRELLARAEADERGAPSREAIVTAIDTQVPSDVGAISEDDLYSLDHAAGTDESDPKEFD